MFMKYVRRFTLYLHISRRGTRRGLAVADDLRIFIRDDAPEDAASPELSPASPSSVASTPSPTSTAFQPTTTGTDLPSPTTTTFTPPTITKTNSSFSTTTTIPPKITSSAVPFLNHPQLSSSALPSSISISSSSIVISSAHVSVTTKPTPTSAGIVLAPAVSDYTSITTTPSPILSNAPTSSATAAHLAVPDITSSSSVAAESVATTTDGLGSNPINHDDYGRVHLDAGSVAGIAVGSSGKYQPPLDITGWNAHQIVY